jgi:hypothetical protein
MSSNGGLTRGRYRFAEWTLTAMPTMSVRYLAKCLSCGERSPDTATSDDAQVWCLKHAGVTGDTGYEMSAFQGFNAAMTDPRERPRAT